MPLSEKEKTYVKEIKFVCSYSRRDRDMEQTVPTASCMWCLKIRRDILVVEVPLEE